MTLLERLTELSVPFCTDEPMSKHVSFKTGGNADVFIIPQGVHQLGEVLKACSQSGMKPLILGNGSNMLIPDSGLRRPIISMDGFDFIEPLGGGVIRCGAGTPLIKLCRYALENALTGLEFAYGIPGTAGGAAVMNAGAYGGEMKDVLLSCSHLDSNGVAGALCGKELDLRYRHSAYSDNSLVITSITVGLHSGSKAAIKEKMDELLQRRKDKQPLEYPSAGSVFKRPEGYFAGALIEQCGLKGRSIGGAQVSEKHAGFIINKNSATTADILELIGLCRSTVLESTGVELEPEIRLAEDM